LPADFWTEARQMLTAGAIVASVAVPAGLAAWVVARRRTQTLLPACKPWRVPWTGFELFAAFAVVSLLIPMLLGKLGLQPLVIGVAAVPLQLAVLVLVARALYPRWNPFRDPQQPEPDDWAYTPMKRLATNVAGLLAFAVLAWVVLTPLVLVFHVGVVQVFTALDWKADEHPLTQFREGALLDQAIFMLQACVAAPLIEEVLFRGLLLPWVIGGRERGAGVSAPLFAPPSVRPWLVMGFAALVAANTGKPGPMIFVGVLAGGLAVVWVAVRRGKRHVRGVYATAAFFAAVHSGVWPSPVPLFLLALGLGWLAVRTRGVLVPFVVHGLFNAVSAVFVLRGGA
jgi:membrane protease YdiL (CAAX protease family)